MKKGPILTVLFSFLLAFLCVSPTYAAELASIQLEIQLDISGELPSSAESFTFVLEAAGDAPMPEANTISITGAGSGRFSSIIYTKPETYHYTVRQIKGDMEGYVYDDTVYDLTVQVTTSDTGALNSVCWVYEQGNNRKTDQILFNNQYLPKPDDTGETPQTGDTSNVGFWIALCSTSLLGLIAVISIHIKTEKIKKCRKI